MKWFVAILLITLWYVIVAYAGTLLDDFNDRNLDGWHLYGNPPRITAEAKNGNVVIDTTIGRNENPVGNFKVLFMELRAGNPENWNSYTLTCRVKFVKVPQIPSTFGISVRRRKGHFNEMAQQTILIISPLNAVSITTTPPDAKRDREGMIGGTIFRKFVELENLRPPIELNQWIPIKIVAEESNFEFYLDDNLLIRYKDEAAVPGTVQFVAETEQLVHLDDVAITGPEIPDIDRPQSVNPERNLTTTWGEIKNSLRR